MPVSFLACGSFQILDHQESQDHTEPQNHKGKPIKVKQSKPIFSVTLRLCVLLVFPCPLAFPSYLPLRLCVKLY
jgi:hypothetical protein